MLSYVNGYRGLSQKQYLCIMVKNIRLLLVVCLVAITGVILLQFFWIRNYYKASLFNFEREINLAFEDAIKKDFELRNDTIEGLLVKELMDTSVFLITSKFLKSVNREVFYIYNRKDSSDFTNFSYSDWPSVPLDPGDTAYKRKVVERYARNLRTDDLERHVVYYRIQDLGKFTLEKVQQYGFDTNRLRPVLQQYLNKRNIHTPYYFHFSKTDSTLNNVDIPDSLARQGVLLTKSFSTYKWWTYEERFIRAAFLNPNQYVMLQMKWILLGSLLLILLVGCCIILLLKALFQEKKLTAIKNDFIHNMSHELKTPVATIAAAVESLQNPDLDPEKQKRYMGHAQKETNRLAGLIDRILNISLYEKDKVSLQREPVPIVPVIKEVIDNLLLTTGKTVNWTVANDTGLDMINVDKVLFYQALTNILDNAIKYSVSPVQLDVWCQLEAGCLQIICRDEGDGIAAAALPNVFEKFYREPQHGHRVKGYGLGLNYVQEIMKAHGGSIEIKSKKGTGTTVKLIWPQAI